MPQQRIIADYLTNPPHSTIEFKDLDTGSHFWNDTPRNGSSLPQFNQKGQVTFLIILFMLIVLTNSVVLTTLGFSKKKSRMNFFILHLAIADLSVGIFSVFPDLIWKATVFWYAGDFMCKVVRYSQAVAIYASNYVLVALSLDRLDAIARPLNFSRKSRRSRLLIAGSWVIGALFSLPMLYLNSDTPQQDEPGVSQCILHIHEIWQWRLYISLIAAAILFIPAIIIMICYAALVHIIWQAGRSSPEQRVYRERSSSLRTATSQSNGKYRNMFSYRKSLQDSMLNNGKENGHISNKNNCIQIETCLGQDSANVTNHRESIKSSAVKEQFADDTKGPSVTVSLRNPLAAGAAFATGDPIAAEVAIDATAAAVAQQVVLVALSCHANQTSDTPMNRADSEADAQYNPNPTDNEVTKHDDNGTMQCTQRHHQTNHPSHVENSADAISQGKEARQTQQLRDSQIKSCNDIANGGKEKTSPNCSIYSCDRCRNVQNNRKLSLVKSNSEGGDRLGAKESDWAIIKICKKGANGISHSKRLSESMIVNPRQFYDEMDIILDSRTSVSSLGGHGWAEQCKPRPRARQHSVSNGLIPKAKIKTVKMSFVIVLAFILCWTPYFVFNLLDVFDLIPHFEHKHSLSVFIQSLATLNSVVNPLIYGFFYSSLSWCVSTSRKRFVNMKQSMECFTKADRSSQSTGMCAARINLQVFNTNRTKSPQLPEIKTACPENFNEM